MTSENPAVAESVKISIYGDDRAGPSGGGMCGSDLFRRGEAGAQGESRGMVARQRQARGLVWSEIAVFLEFGPRNLRDIRDRALVAVAYDITCQREELVSLAIEDIEPAEDGSGTVVIRRSKTDVAGEGTTAYLSPLTMRLLAAWFDGSGLRSGPIFALVVGRDGVGDPLTSADRHRGVAEGENFGRAR
jgi:hypothetical protein